MHLHRILSICSVTLAMGCGSADGDDAGYPAGAGGSDGQGDGATGGAGDTGGKSGSNLGMAQQGLSVQSAGSDIGWLVDIDFEADGTDIWVLDDANGLLFELSVRTGDIHNGPKVETCNGQDVISAHRGTCGYLDGTTEPWNLAFKRLGKVYATTDKWQTCGEWCYREVAETSAIVVKFETPITVVKPQ